jgi:hypothetical protein
VAGLHARAHKRIWLPGAGEQPGLETAKLAFKAVISWHRRREIVHIRIQLFYRTFLPGSVYFLPRVEATGQAPVKRKKRIEIMRESRRELRVRLPAAAPLRLVRSLRRRRWLGHRPGGRGHLGRCGTRDSAATRNQFAALHRAAFRRRAGLLPISDEARTMKWKLVLLLSILSMPGLAHILAWECRSTWTISWLNKFPRVTGTPLRSTHSKFRIGEKACRENE